MRALSIRQPYAELILRGIKGIEFRSRPTTIIGQRFYIYASKQWAVGKLFLEGCRRNAEFRIPNAEGNPNVQIPSAAGLHGPIVGDNIELPTDGPEPWMLELAEMLILKDLPTGVIVGTAVIERCVLMGDGNAECQMPNAELSGNAECQMPNAEWNSVSPIRHSAFGIRNSLYEWHLTDVERAKRFRKPKGRPQPVWFTPFD
jgi:ASCH domain